LKTKEALGIVAWLLGVSERLLETAGKRICEATKVEEKVD
jgi:hypothetical protein